MGLWVGLHHVTSVLELSVGPISSTQHNPTHQMIDPTQPNPYHSENVDPG